MAQRPKSRRASVQQAASVPEREEWYRHECDEIARRLGVVIRLEDGKTYLDTTAGSKLLCQPLRPKRIWYETWLAMDLGRGA